MSYIALSCFSSKVPLKDTNKPKVLETDEKATIITDIVVAVLISTVGVLALIQITGLASLSYLSCLGAIGSKAAYAMIGVGAGLAAIDLIKFMIQQARHISKLQSLESTRNSEREQQEEKLSIQTRESAQIQLEAQRKPYEKHIRGEEERTRKAIEKATEELNDQIEEFQGQLKIARQEAEKPLLEEIERLTKELEEVAKRPVKEDTAELNRQIEVLQGQLKIARQEAEKPLLEEIERLTKELEEIAKRPVKEDSAELSRQIEVLKEQLENAEEEAKKPLLEEIEKLKSERAEVVKHAVEEASKELNRQIEVLQKQLENAEEEAKKPLLEEIEKLKSERDNAVKHAVEKASAELNRRIEILQKQLVSAKEETVRLQEQIEKLTKEYDKAVRAAVEKAEKPLNERICKLKQEELEVRTRLKLEGELEEIRRQVEDAKHRQSKSALETKETLAKLEEEKQQLEETIRQMELRKQELEHSKKKDAVPEIIITSDPVKKAPIPPKAPTPPKAPELPKPEPSEPDKILAPAIAPAVVMGLNHSLLVRAKLNLGSQLKAPQMESGARNTILRLVETKIGLQKIKGAVLGFQEYLEEKVEDLKAKPSSNPQVVAYQTALSVDLSNSLFGSEEFDEIEDPMNHSFMATVSERIDLDELDPNLEAYFITLSNWIKEAEEPEAQIKRIEVAMEQFTYELLDAVRNQSAKALEDTKSRLESDRKRNSEIMSIAEEMLEVTQQEKIESALIHTPTAEDLYDLRTLDFATVGIIGKGQIHQALKLMKSVPETIKKLETLKEELVAEADRLLKLDLKVDRSREIEALQKQADVLIRYIEAITRECKLVPIESLLKHK